MDRQRFFWLAVMVVALLALGVGVLQATEPYQRAPAPAQILGPEDVPAKISYQGMLTESGSAVNGNRNFVFKLFTTTDCTGSALATITKNNVAVEDGLFHTVLDVNPAHFNVQPLRLRVEVGAAALGCEEILPAPFALFSASTGSLHMQPVSAAAPAANQVLKWNGTNWAAAADANTTYTAGTGLILTTTQFSVNFAGSGSATTVAHSDHNHFGQSWSGSATNGLAISNSGAGVAIYGNATASSDNTKGVYGRSASSDGAGVYGFAAANPGTSSFGVVGHHFWGGTGVGAWSYTGRIFEGRSGDYPAGTLRFYVTNGGQVYAQGGYISFVPTSEGENNDHAALYAMQSPEAWFEDFGTASLVDGQAKVFVDSLFAATVNLDTDYHVFLTPMGESNNLYVLNQTSTSFEVREASGGRAGISFHYRIVAKRRGYEEVRFETVLIEERAQPERKEFGPHE
jgi:hypothetical protein